MNQPQMSIEPVAFDDPDVTIPAFGANDATEGDGATEDVIATELDDDDEPAVDLDAAQAHEIEQAAITALTGGTEPEDEPIAAETDVFDTALGSLKNTLAEALGRLEELSEVKSTAAALDSELAAEDKATRETIQRLRDTADDLEAEHKERQRLRRGYEG